MVPTLTTDRLTLRGWREDDLDAYAAITADPEVMRFMGGTLGRAAWGHGYATEAARAAVEYAWRELDAQQLISLIAPDNAASAAVAGRLGMRPTDDYDLAGQHVVIHRLDR